VELKKRKAQRISLPSLGTGQAEEVLMSRANTVIEHLSSPHSSMQHSPDVLSPLSAFQQSFDHNTLLSGMPTLPGMLPQQFLPPPSPTRMPPSPPSPPVSVDQLSTPRLSFGSAPPSPPLPTPRLYESTNQHAFQVALATGDPAVNSSERAIFRIVEMGFTHDEAKGALKITDMGDGLRVDRAVEYLLRQQGVL
jgi:hypothetical protein